MYEEAQIHISPRSQKRPSVPIQAISDHFTQQAGWNKALGSPLTADLLLNLKSDFESRGVIADLVARWPTNPVRDALGLRLLGAIHYTALSGKDERLAALFPEPGKPAGSADDIWNAAKNFLEANQDWARDFIAQPPQTNETRRGFMFLYGFLELARRFDMPARMLELGASAGLNQNFDRFRYSTRSWKWGDPLSPVEVTTDWQADQPPLTSLLNISERLACDQHPLDLSDPETRLRLKSYIWADQPERLSRFDAAVDLAVAHDTKVEKADAAKWLDRELDTLPDGQLTVVCHSVFLQYPPRETRAHITHRIERAGEAATKTSPLAWLRYEPEALWTKSKSPKMLLDLRIWPGNLHIKLAQSDGHVRLVTDA